MESMVQEVQCPTYGSVSKTRLKRSSVMIAPHPPLKSRAVRNVTRWVEQELDWVLVKTSRQGARNEEGKEMKQESRASQRKIDQN
jgi:hypothetical protein